MCSWWIVHNYDSLRFLVSTHFQILVSPSVYISPNYAYSLLILYSYSRKVGREVMFSIWIKWVKTTSGYLLMKTNIIFIIVFDPASDPFILHTLEKSLIVLTWANVSEYSGWIFYSKTNIAYLQQHKHNMVKTILQQLSLLFFIA